jgi:hypothetical protein
MLLLVTTPCLYCCYGNSSHRTILKSVFHFGGHILSKYTLYDSAYFIGVYVHLLKTLIYSCTSDHTADIWHNKKIFFFIFLYVFTELKGDLNESDKS